MYEMKINHKTSIFLFPAADSRVFPGTSGTPSGGKPQAVGMISSSSTSYDSSS